MKNLLYILALTFLFSSCRSIDKMVESGNYDQALRYGVDKLIGKENKKTKYVKGLEKAYAKLNDRDIKEINKLTLEDNQNSLHKIVSVYQMMKDRQTYITPLLPLISSEGYPATFKTTDYNILIHESKINATKRHYQNAKELLADAIKKNNKLLARKAYYEANEALTYFDKYKNTQIIKSEALSYGQTNVLIEPYILGANQAFYHTGEIIKQIDLAKLNTIWKKFQTEDYGQFIDYVATIEVSEIIPGKERERFNSFTNTKEIIDGKHPIKTKNGNIKKDTMGNIIYKDKRMIVEANIEELIREKTAQMSGKVVIMNANNNQHVTTIPINVTYLFEDYSCVFRGDKRALNNKYNKRIKEYCSPFPTDYEMTTNLAYEYKSVAEQSIKNQKLI